MALSYTTKLALSQAAKGDLIGAWITIWNQDNQRMEDRLAATHAGDPNTHVAGYWVGQFCFDTTNAKLYYCSVPNDNAALAEWAQLTPNFYELAPSGTILLWDKLEADIPSGWSKVVGVDGKYLLLTESDATIRGLAGQASVTTGGSGTHDHTGTVGDTTLTIAQMPAHTHPITGGFASANQAGGSGFNRALPTNGNTDSTGGGQSHTHTLTIANGGGHSHTVETLPPGIKYMLIKKD